jgi:phosphinothricin acetyltransferase
VKPRLARIDDAPGIAAIWNHYIRETTITFTSTEKTPEEIAALIQSRPAFFVVDGERGIAGFATYAQFRGGDGYARCMEHTIQLAPSARGSGLGRSLLSAVEDHARNGGAHSIFAGVSAENAAGLAFHRRMGYEATWTLPQTGWKFGRWLDLVLMQKFLS